MVILKVFLVVLFLWLVTGFFYALADHYKPKEG